MHKKETRQATVRRWQKYTTNLLPQPMARNRNGWGRIGEKGKTTNILSRRKIQRPSWRQGWWFVLDQSHWSGRPEELILGVLWYDHGRRRMDPRGKSHPRLRVDMSRAQGLELFELARGPSSGELIPRGSRERFRGPEHHGGWKFWNSLEKCYNQKVIRKYVYFFYH